MTELLPKQMRYQTALHPDMAQKRGIPSLFQGNAQLPKIGKAEKNRNKAGTSRNPRHNHDTLAIARSRGVPTLSALAGAGAA